MFSSGAPDCIILSSDSEDDKKSKADLSLHKSNSKVSSFAGTSTNVKADPDSNNPLIKQKISVNKDTVTVKLVTQFRSNFSGLDSPDKVRQNTRSTTPCNKKRVELKRSNDSSGNKFMLGSGPPPIKKMFLQKNSTYNSSDAEIIEVKTSKRCSSANFKPCFPLIPLGKPSATLKKDDKPNLTFDLISPKPIINSDLIKPRLKQISNADLIQPSTSSKADKMKSKPMSLADMPDVKNLINVYEEYAKDEGDKLVAKLLQKKMKKLPINSLTEYEDVYKAYVLSIQRKITNNPSKTNLHLREFVDEIKKCKKSKSEPLIIASVSSAVCEPKPSTSKEIDCSNSTSSSFSPDAKIKLLEKKMQILNKKIVELQKKDISLEEMDENSPYVLIEKYEKKYMQLLTCYRKLTDIPVCASRGADKPYKYRGSRYSEFNSAVGKLVRRLKPDLPDFSDFHGLACECNKRYGYKLNDFDVKYLARNTLEQVVEEIKKRRGYDFNVGLEQWLELNMGQVCPDPAKTDESLKAQLKKNNQLAREKTEAIMKHYAEKQEEFEKSFPEQHKKLMEQGEQDDNDEEEEEEEDDEGTSDFELIDEEIAKEISNQTDSAIIEDIETFPDDIPSSESLNETDSENSGKTDDENESHLGGNSPLPDLTTIPVKQPSDGLSSLKIVSVEGAGNLFYSCESSPHKNFIFKCSTDETNDSEIITLD